MVESNFLPVNMLHGYKVTFELFDGYPTPNNRELSFIHRNQIPGMPMNQNIFLLCIRNMCINFRCADRTVPQHFLDVPDIHILFQQQGGKGVSEHMRGNVLADVGKLCITVNHEADRLI